MWNLGRWYRCTCSRGGNREAHAESGGRRRWSEWEMRIDIYILLREGNGTPLQYSCLENPMDGGAWKVAVHGVTEGQTWLSDFTFTFHFHALEKAMATHSSTLAWRIPGTREPGGLQSMGSHRVGHDRSDLAAAAAEIITGVTNAWICTQSPG